MFSKNCTICQTKLKGSFCYNCGQNVTNKKASVFTIIFDFFANIFSVQSSFLTTFIAVFKRPVFLVNNYYEGNKGVLIAPGKFVLFTSLFLALRFYYFEESFWGLTMEVSGKEYFLIGLMFIFPVLASIILFAKKKNILIRSIISMSYISSFNLIILTLIEIPFLLINVTLDATFVLFMFFSIFGLNSIVFSENKRWFLILLNTVLQLIILVIIFAIIILLLSYYFPKNFSV